MPHFGPKYLGWEPSNNIISKKLLFDFSTDSRVLDYEFEAYFTPFLMSQSPKVLSGKSGYLVLPRKLTKINKY